MKKLLLLALLTALLAGLTHQDALAQHRKKKKKSSGKMDEYFDESGNVWARMWYGAQVGQIAFFNNQFAAAVSPMAAYKITERLSAGLITKISYTYERVRGIPGVRNFQTLDLSAGPMVRYRIIPALFAHVEYELTRFEHLPTDNFGNPLIIIEEDKIKTEHTTQPYAYVGLGYESQVGVWGYEISLLYNLLDRADSFRIPWDLRFGMNYNF